MAKDAYYFPHDYNARNDVKCLFLRQQLGMEGYGIFWFLIESLADSGGKLPIKIVPVLAMQMQVPDVKVFSVINSFELFELDDDGFFSKRLNTHLELRKTLSQKGKEGANLRWKNSPPISLPISKGNAKERKGKERKENIVKPTPPDLLNSNLFRQPVIPTKEEVLMCFIQNGGNKEMADSYYARNESTGWFYKGSPITNFRTQVYSFVTNWKKNNKEEEPRKKQVVI